VTTEDLEVVRAICAENSANIETVLAITALGHALSQLIAIPSYVTGFTLQLEPQTPNTYQTTMTLSYGEQRTAEVTHINARNRTLLLVRFDLRGQNSMNRIRYSTRGAKHADDTLQ
jgi:hypothetical protein